MENNPQRIKAVVVQVKLYNTEALLAALPLPSQTQVVTLHLNENHPELFLMKNKEVVLEIERKKSD